jgi:hypothetical protein
MQSFTYKPALLRGAVVYEVTDLSLVCRTKEGGETWRMDWDQIENAAFVDQKFRRNDIRRLDLITPSGRRSIAYSGLTDIIRTDPNSVAHLQLLSAILKKLNERTTDFPIIIGEYGRNKTIMFAVGIFTLLCGAGLIAVAAGTGLSTDKFMELAVPSGIMILFGSVICYKNRPGRAEVTLPAGLLSETLTGVLDGTHSAKIT